MMLYLFGFNYKLFLPGEQYYADYLEWFFTEEQLDELLPMRVSDIVNAFGKGTDEWHYIGLGGGTGLFVSKEIADKFNEEAERNTQHLCSWQNVIRFCIGVPIVEEDEED
ncbi:MAG: hypothetical protein KBT10_02890 [Bacteroidales bacterium]|nr:hypothetical protein [Candidatus Sodaliphilus aphodohippi]